MVVGLLGENESANHDYNCGGGKALHGELLRQTAIVPKIESILLRAEGWERGGSGTVKCDWRLLGGKFGQPQFNAQPLRAESFVAASAFRGSSVRNRWPCSGSIWPLRGGEE